jgi:sugar fermentation stimulation protein A
LLARHRGKHPYKLLYTIYKGRPVFVDSIACNAVFAGLLRQRLVPGLERLTLTSREPAFGEHRFDFLARDGRGKRVLIELKTCTLAWKGVAAFPDAPTERGVKHIKALCDAGKGMLIFFILHGNAECLVPDYHTHFEFYETLRGSRKSVDIRAFAAVYDKDLRITGARPVPVRVPQVRPAGSYLLVYRNPSDTRRFAGALGEISFPAGYYVYAGSGMGNLFARITRHRRKRINPRWHIDYLKKTFILLRDLPVVSPVNIECMLADSLEELGGRRVRNFGSTDCGCQGHLLHFTANPLEREEFWDMVLEARFGAYGSGAP